MLVGRPQQHGAAYWRQERRATTGAAAGWAAEMGGVPGPLRLPGWGWAARKHTTHAQQKTRGTPLQRPLRGAPGAPAHGLEGRAHGGPTRCTAAGDQCCLGDAYGGCKAEVPRLPACRGRAQPRQLCAARAATGALKTGAPQPCRPGGGAGAGTLWRAAL
ncbi:MAG: hypothetical protein J3K34DRAFT_442360, partial [Monoraphidium minutum]